METSFRVYQFMTLSILFLGFGWFIYGKSAVSHAIPALMEEEKLSKNEIGAILSSQNLAAAFSRFFGAILSDHVNAKIMLPSGLFLCGVSNLLFATSSTHLGLMATMFLNGMCQGCGWPVCCKVLRRWVAPSQYGTAWSVLQSGANAAGILSPLISTYLILHHGWRSCMVVQGVSAVVFAIIAAITLIESPTKVGYEEPSSSGPKRAKQDSSAEPHGTFMDLLQSPFIVTVALVQIIALAIKTILCDWGQLYLMHERGHSQLVVSTFKSSMEMGGLLGRMLLGLVSDLVVKSSQRKPKSSKGNPRMPVAVASMLAITLGLHWFQAMVTETSSQWSIAMVGACLGAFVYGMSSLVGVIASESVPHHLNGSVIAIVGTCGAVGGILGGLPCTFLAQRTAWKTVFVCAEVIAAVAGTTIFCLRNLTCSVDERRKKKTE